ncbi:hypothetical protein TSAR_013001 [Trichomalopsis sarcophagae]|uniref:Gustatory receptor n=1 Tax=Trichomalopsis sarcophagae TaxID=543379 RepID=A0A232F909_9HYME|nr:hypothetical protein TSAR_013001 [Trichomalopsis sarcophagae]
MVDLNPISKSVLPVLIVNWIFGIGVIEYPLGNPHPIFSFIYSLISVILFAALAICNYFNIDLFIKVTPGIAVPIKVIYFSQIILVMSTVILGWYRSKVIHECVVKEALADNLMEHIGIQKNYKQMLKVQIGNVLGALTFALSVIIINSCMIFMNDKIPLRYKVSSAFTMGYPVLVTFIADTTFMNIVWKTKKANILQTLKYIIRTK